MQQLSFANQNTPSRAAGRMAWCLRLALLGLLTAPLAALAQPTGYCTTNLGAYCGAGNANIAAVAIAGTTLNNPNTTCNSATGYTLWPAAGNTTAALSPGVSYQVSVTTPESGIISVWGDWNKNGQLEASEWTQITTSSTAGQPATASVSVPATALAGLTYFRVRSRLMGNPNGAGDACLTFGSGETEDYIVTIGPPPSCAPPINLSVSNVSTTSATFAFSGASNGTAIGYTVQYGVAGFTPGGAGSTTIPTTSTSVPLAGLLANTAYEVYVSKDCGGGDVSIRNGPFAFRTACVAPVYASVPLVETFENPWVGACSTRDVPSTSWLNTPATGNLSWRRDDDGAAAGWTSPTFGAFTLGSAQGAHAARFHDYSASTTTTGLLGTLDLLVNLGGSAANILQFDYINADGVDSLLVELSTNGGSTFGRPLLRLGVSAAFGTRTLSLPAGGSATSVIRFRAKTDLFGSTDIGLDNVRVAALTTVPGCATNLTPASGTAGVQRPVTLTWQSGTGITTGYDVYFGSSSTTLALVSSNQAATSYAVASALAGNTTYYYQVVPRNGLGPATGCSVASFTTNNLLVYCTTNLGAYCGAGNANIAAVAIAGTTLNNPNTTCNSATGYTLWPAAGNTTAALSPGASYQVSVTTPESGIISVWGDWNQNGTFEPSEWTQIATASTAGQPATATVNVPATAGMGLTYFRVRSRLMGNPNGAADACLTFGSGETEDYIVTIGPPPACAPPFNLAVTGLTTTSGTLTFSGASNGTAVGYIVQYGPAGFTPGGTGGTTLNTTSTSVPLAGLMPGTPYQVYVTKDCGGGQLSMVNGPFAFNTPIVNDEPCTATLLPVNNTCQPTAATSVSATATPSSVFAGGSAGTGCGFNTATPLDVWFKFTTAASGPTSTAVRIAVTGGAASVVRAYSGSSCAGPLTFLSCAGTASNTAAPNLDLTTLAPNTTYYLRVHTYATTDVLGSFTICASPVPNCPAPAGLTAGTVTGTTAQLSWGATTPAGSTFTVIYGPAGFSPGTGGTSLTGLTTSSTTLTGLSPTTAYSFYVQQVCGGFNGSSVLVGPVSFTTPVALPGNDEPCGAVALGNSPVSSSNLGATTSLQPGINLPACAPSQAPKDVWFTFTPTGSSTTLTINGTAVGMVRLFTTTDCTNGPLVPVDCRAATGANVGFPAPLTFTGLTAGQRYYVTVSGYGSSDSGGNFTIAGTLLGSRTATETTLLLYPNPSNTGQLTLRLNSPAPAQATLLNTLGQVVRRQSIAAGGSEQSFGTQGLAAGVYTLRVLVSGELLTRKVVLE